MKEINIEVRTEGTISLLPEGKGDVERCLVYIKGLRESTNEKLSPLTAEIAKLKKRIGDLQRAADVILNSAKEKEQAMSLIIETWYDANWFKEAYPTKLLDDGSIVKNDDIEITEDWQKEHATKTVKFLNGRLAKRAHIGCKSGESKTSFKIEV